MAHSSQGSGADRSPEATSAEGRNTAVSHSAEESSANTDRQTAKFDELLDSLLNDKKNTAIEKHPELASAYKALEVYEHYFLAGGDWDEVGAVEFKKKMAQKIITELLAKDD